MAINNRILEQGTLTTSAAATLYTVPATLLAFITSIKLVNTNGSAHTFNIYVKKSGGSAIQYSGVDVSLSDGVAVQVLDDPQELRLAAGDQICGDADANSVVTFTISGVEVG